MNGLSFGCTLCGRCCHGHSVPLTFDESILWLQDGGKVGVFCEAHTSLEAPDPPSVHHLNRSFVAVCGAAPVAVTAILVGLNSAACHHLLPDMKCGAYERRPLVCRIYPAEINPFIQLNPASKLCPPEAWLSGGPLMNQHVLELVEKSRQADRGDTNRKARLCERLGIDVAAIAGEGYIAYEPDRSDMLQALLAVREQPAATRTWSLYSPFAATSELLKTAGFDVLLRSPHQFLYAPARVAA